MEMARQKHIDRLVRDLEEELKEYDSLISEARQFLEEARQSLKVPTAETLTGR